MTAYSKCEKYLQQQPEIKKKKTINYKIYHVMMCVYLEEEEKTKKILRWK